MDFKNWLFTGALVAGLGMTGYAQYFADGNTLNELVRNLLLAVFGGGGLVYNNASWVTSLVAPKPKKFGEQIFKPEHFESEDFKCLVHLRNRVTAANDADGIVTCAKLNDIIFNLRRREELASKEPADATKAV